MPPNFLNVLKMFGIEKKGINENLLISHFTKKSYGLQKLNIFRLPKNVEKNMHVSFFICEKKNWIFFRNFSFVESSETCGKKVIIKIGTRKLIVEISFIINYNFYYKIVRIKWIKSYY